MYNSYIIRESVGKDRSELLNQDVFNLRSQSQSQSPILLTRMRLKFSEDEWRENRIILLAPRYYWLFDPDL